MFIVSEMTEKLNKRIAFGFADWVYKNYTWICSSLITAFFMFGFMKYFKVSPFGFNTFNNSDCFHQIYPMLAVLHDKLRSGESLFYYWNSGLGGDFLPTYFYYISSPLNLLVYFIDKSDIDGFICILVAVKTIISSGTFGYFLSRKNGFVCNSVFYVALSCAYALSNYMSGYYLDLMWLDTIMVFPLIILGYNRMIKEHKPMLYIISLAYSLFCNYYISYIVCVFLIIWFLIDDHKSPKNFFFNGLRFALFSILSAAMVAVPLITSYIGITKTISNDESIVSHSWYGNIFFVLRNVFIFSNPISTSYLPNVANLYCGSFCILFVFSYIFIKNGNFLSKVKRLCLLILLIISMNETVLNFIWHGFHIQHSVPNRFSFLYIFLVLLISSEVFDFLSDKKSVKEALPTIIGTGFSLVFSFVSYFFVDYDSFLSSHHVLLLSLVLFFLYEILLLSQFSREQIKKLGRIIISVLMLLEILINAVFSYKISLDQLSFANEFINYFDSIISHVETNDDEMFYRSEVADGVIDNENAYHGIKGIGSFNSTSNKDFNVFLYFFGHHTWKNRIHNSQISEYINSICGVKYIYSIEANKDYDDFLSYNVVYRENSIKVIKNEDALSLGFGVSNRIRDYKLDYVYDLEEEINGFVQKTAIEKDIIKEIIPNYDVSVYGCEIENGDKDYLNFKYKNLGNEKNIVISYIVEDDGQYYMDTRENNEDMITYKVNDEIIRQSIWLTNGISRLGKLKKGDKVELIISDNTGKSYQANDNISEVNVFTYIIDEKAVHEYAESLKHNQLQLKAFSDAEFSGSVNLDKDQLLFLSIPYDKGWHVYENGKEIKTEKLADTFLGVDLGEGNHELTFKFVPEGLYISLFISVVAWISFIILIVLMKRQYQKKQTGESKE
ncbi:Uncharacterized membrane protein YfhO [Lachnospiraceae bacterium]|nr:Uncharacterized membrane protein YfhO [Lachnospiraceae bacterium]